MKRFLLIFLTVVQYITLSTTIKLDSKYEWKYIEYDWDSDEDKQAAIDSGSYVKGASLPVDVDQYVNEEIDDDGEITSRTTMKFITLLRKPGVPATLTTITEKEGEGGLLLRPYPDWSSTKDCSGYTNVHRLAINRCGQMWVLDSGIIDFEQVCPAKLTIIDLKTDKVIQEMEVPKEVIKGELTNIVVQPLDNDCKNSAAFMADSLGNALVIYDGQKFCKMDGPEFEPQVEAEDFVIGDDKTHQEIGLLGLSITPPDDGTNDQILYFRPLASFYLYHANAKELRDYCTTGQKPTLKKLNYALPSQSVVHAIDANGVLFYNSVEGTSINCWSTWEVFSSRNTETLEKNAEKFQWISGMKISPPEKDLASLFVISNRYQKYVNEELNDDEVNFRVFETNAYLAVYGTDCY